jgi:hypothetical protein
MSGNWCPPPPGHGLPADQRPDDARSAAFTTAALAAPLEVFGQPIAWLTIAHPGPAAIVSVKLSDVSPLGEAQLVTSGVLNLAHRASHERPEPFSGVGDVRVELQATGWRFETGHRIRVAVAGSDWPTVWPLPTTDPLVLTIGPGEPCRIELPRVPSDSRPFTPTGSLMGDVDQAGWEEHAKPSTWRIVTDAMAGTSGIEASDAWATSSAMDGISASETRRYRAFIDEADPLLAEVNGSATFTLDRPGLSVRSVARGRFTATADVFTYNIRLEVRDADQLVHRDRWRGSVPRRLC